MSAKNGPINVSFVDGVSTARLPGGRVVLGEHIVEKVVEGIETSVIQAKSQLEKLKAATIETELPLCDKHFRVARSRRCKVAEKIYGVYFCGGKEGEPCSY